jgi:hypothetical protein
VIDWQPYPAHGGYDIGCFLAQSIPTEQRRDQDESSTSTTTPWERGDNSQPDDCYRDFRMGVMYVAHREPVAMTCQRPRRYQRAILEHHSTMLEDIRAGTSFQTSPPASAVPTSDGTAMGSPARYLRKISQDPSRTHARRQSLTKQFDAAHGILIADSAIVPRMRIPGRVADMIVFNRSLPGRASRDDPRILNLLFRYRRLRSDAERPLARSTKDT